MKCQFCYANRESPQDGCWIMNLYGLKIVGSNLLLPPFSSPSYVAFKLCKNNLDENEQNKATNKKNVASTAATMSPKEEAKLESNPSTRAEWHWTWTNPRSIWYWGIWISELIYVWWFFSLYFRSLIMITLPLLWTTSELILLVLHMFLSVKKFARSNILVQLVILPSGAVSANT